MKLRLPAKNQLNRKRASLDRLGRLVLVLLIAGVALAGRAQHQSLRLEVEHRFGGELLSVNKLLPATSGDAPFSVTRLDYLLSGLGLQREDGTWLDSRDWFAFISAESGRLQSTIPSMPAAKFRAVRFKVGVPPDVNAADPARHPPDAPLHPQVNGLHWGWQGGYVFLALEGRYAKRDNSLGGYSYHIANDENLMHIELPVEFNAVHDTTLTLTLHVDRILQGTNMIRILDRDSTHSRMGDPLAAQFRANIEGAFAVTGVSTGLFHSLSTGGAEVSAGRTNATPFKLRVSERLPRPSLPVDNPLSEEGVALGRKLFFEKKLSRDNTMSCANCHLPEQAFTDGDRQFSRGVNGQVGKRNSMPLHNLVWADKFFWDGRAGRLREQALLPIADPTEMDLPLTEALERLQADAGYLRLFAQAFGSAEINDSRVGLAFEQFLISLVSQDAKFDRAVRGEMEFNDQEKRGFELFVTEHDPARNLFGADCFHCHGGSLFTNHRFANNGLDREFKDSGRFLVTGDEADRGKFKTPSLRNVELTTPYMHDGRFATLEEVVDHYDHGVQPSATLDPNLAKHLPGGLKLSAADKAALVAFLKALTDRDFGTKTIIPH